MPRSTRRSTAPAARPTRPGAFRRFARDRGRIAVTGALALAGLLVGLLPAGFGWVLHGSDAERGPYDLIVTAGAEAFPDGLVPPGFVTEERMSLDELDIVRGIEGVGVAAPFGLVAAANWPNIDPRYSVELTDSTTPDPQAFRTNLTVTTDDGTGERLVSEQEIIISVDRSDAPPTPVEPVLQDGQWTCVRPDGGWTITSEKPAPGACAEPQYHVAIQPTASNASTYVNGMEEGEALFTLTMTPQTGQWVALLDPIAEAELAGPGTALDELAAYERASAAGELASWPEDHDGDAAEAIRWYVEHTEEPLSRIRPAIVLDTPRAVLRHTLDIAALGPTAMLGDGTPRYTLLDERPSEPVGSIDLDLGDRTAPFATQDVPRVRWPAGPVLDGEPVPFRSWSFADDVLPARPMAYEGERIVPQKPAAMRSAWLDVDARTTAYQGLDLGGGTAGSVQPSTGFVPVADADASAVAIDGALGSGPRRLVADAEGTPVDAVELLPSLSGLGIGSGAPGVVTSFAAFGETLPPNPIHAIRVRIDGDPATPAGLRALQDTAERIRAAGFGVSVAAGAHEVEREFVVDGYAYGTDAAGLAGGSGAGTGAAASSIRSVGVAAAGDDRIGVLGTIRETWTKLPAADAAAARPDAPASAAALLALTAALGLLVLAEARRIRRNRDEALVLRSLGRPTANVFWWFAGPATITFGIVLVVTQAALAVGGGAWHAETLQAFAGAVLLVEAAAVTAVLRLARPGTAPHWLPRRMPRWAPHLVVAAGWTLIAASIAVVALLTVEEVRATGAAFFAEAAGDAYYLVPLALAVLAGAAGLLLAVRGRRRA
ncbi:hypothetical protein [Agromyces archimandritae]|uniref:Uncharacterized protein n=1 Tax=Agromyces archimandritae TaxID=2781962 RepID=A0A975FKP1_9MICO|nr:hypothetical protein [Agromyces archimandritae]QTX03687.1 hypothetical protein G127AT_10105 [Agromyces archimandritae]